MNDIQRIDGYGGVAPLGPHSGGPANHAHSPPKPTDQEDHVEISQIARFMSKIAAMPEIRVEKVENVRQALAQGAYDVEGKLSAALDNLFIEEDL